MVSEKVTIQRLVGKRRGAYAAAIGAVMFVFALIPPHSSAAGDDSSTTGTLLLRDLFDTRPGPSGFIPGAARYDPAGPVIVIPDTSSWRLPPATPRPTPSPTPNLPERADIPRLPLLITQPREAQTSIAQSAFKYRGQRMSIAPTNYSVVQVDTEFSQLRTEYRLTGVSSDDEPINSGLVFLHAPGTSERFEVPSGRYRLERKIWRADSPAKARVEVYAAQELAPNGLYIYTAARESEADLVISLRK